MKKSIKIIAIIASIGIIAALIIASLCNKPEVVESTKMDTLNQYKPDTIHEVLTNTTVVTDSIK